MLANLETLKTDAGNVHQGLYESDDSLLDQLKGMAGTLDHLSGLDPQLTGIAAQVRDATITLEESAMDLSRYLNRLDLDPAELAETTDRLNTINRVLHKYTGDIESTVALRSDLAKKIATLENATEDLTALRESLAPLRKQLKQLGDELTTKRTAVAKQLGPLVERGLADLGMDKAKFAIAVAPAATTPDGPPAATATGLDHVEFVAQTNPGQLAQPLRKIASGGELSRIMLALKGILAKGDRVDVLVFDEIDSNVGGRLGSVIGNKLRGLAASHQVLCITHLPQIASYADRHFTVRKEVTGGKTESQVRRMDGTERLQEIAEMIGGHKITDHDAGASAGAVGGREGGVRFRSKEVSSRCDTAERLARVACAEGATSQGLTDGPSRCGMSKKAKVCGPSCSVSRLRTFQDHNVVSKASEQQFVRPPASRAGATG